MVTRSIPFRDDVYDQLLELSQERDLSINWLVNQLCREGLDRLAPDFRLTKDVAVR